LVNGVDYRPNLLTAKTIAHEVIHPEMFRKLMSVLDNGGNLDGLTKQEWTQKLSDGDYPGIFDYYTRYGVNGFQHQQMAAHYRSSIVQILKAFQPGLRDDIYSSLAWVGLHGTDAWNDLPNGEKLKIQRIYSNFENNGSESCN